MPVNEDLISYLINYLLYQPCPIFSRIMVFMSCPILFASMSVSVSAGAEGGGARGGTCPPEISNAPPPPKKT